MDETVYNLQLKSKTDRGKDIYNFESADGVASKNSFRKSELALADNLNPKLNDDLLIVQTGYGFLPVIMADKAPKGKTLAAETSDRAYQLTKTNLKKNNIQNATAQKTAFYNELEQKFDKIIYAPKSYTPVKIVKNRISNLIPLLKNQGELFIAGKKTDGINRYKKHLDALPGKNQKATQDGKQRIYRYTKTDNFEPESSDIETQFTAETNNIKLDFTACEGLFSPKTLDKGSRLLIENLELSENEKVLDIACGYGPIGIFLKKTKDVNLHLSDDDATAVHYAKKNLENNNIENYKLKNKDCLDGFKHQKFDTIISNPPTHQGSGVTNEIFKEAHKTLKKGGKLYLVYNQNMRYEDQLNQKFNKVELVGKKDNYAVTRAIK